MKPRKIRYIVSNIAFREDHIEKLHKHCGGAAIELIDANDQAGLELGLDKADVAFLNPDVSAADLMRPNLHWVHVDIAGLNKYASRELIESGPIITGSAGRSAPALAEQALMFMLSFAFQAPRLYDAQKKRQWGIEGQSTLSALYAKTVAIIGMGNTGFNIAKRCKAFEMQVLGYTRSAKTGDYVDHLYSAENGDELEPVLAQADFVVVCVPLTNQSYKMIGQRELSAMKSDAVLINLARGEVVDELALIGALQTEGIGGAGLDTFDIEPLPADSLLWSLPNVLITPHMTPKMPDRTGQSLQIILGNIKRYFEGGVMLNQLTDRDIYVPQ